MYDYVTLDKKERQILYRILAFIPPNYEFDFDEVVHSSNPDAYPSALYGYIESFLEAQGFVKRIKNSSYELTSEGRRLQNIRNYKLYKLDKFIKGETHYLSIIATVLSIWIGITQLAQCNKTKKNEAEIKTQKAFIDSLKRTN